MLQWTEIFKRVSWIEDPDLGVGSVLNQLEKEGNKLTIRELRTVVGQLRKFKRFKHALEVYEWMNNRIERFKPSSNDTATELDLTAKVHGVSSAEDYFVRIPDAEKDNRIYGALLNAYVGAKNRDKAESLLDQMRKKGHITDTYAFNLMMTLHKKLNEHDKVDQLISEMKQKHVRLDIYSYNIWLSAHGSKGSAEGMEHVWEQMKLDSTIYPSWATFSTMASLYMKLGQIEKAEDCLINLEARITGRDNKPYYYLISLYATLGKKEEVYRVWSLYKSKLPRVPNWGYHTMISALIRLGEIEEAEKFYQEWLQGKPIFDPRVGNILMGWYAHREPFEKTKYFFDQIIEAGERPDSGSWMILGEAHTKAGRISDALSCFREAFSLSKAKLTFKPKLRSVSAFLELCEKEQDTGSKDEFVELLRELGCFQDRTYEAILARHTGVEVSDHDDHSTWTNETVTDDIEEPLSEGSEMLFSVME